MRLLLRVVQLLQLAPMHIHLSTSTAVAAIVVGIRVVGVFWEVVIVGQRVVLGVVHVVVGTKVVGVVGDVDFILGRHFASGGVGGRCLLYGVDVAS